MEAKPKSLITGGEYDLIPGFPEFAEYLQDSNSYRLGGVFLIRRKNRLTYIGGEDNIDFVMEIRNPNVTVPYEFSENQLARLENEGMKNFKEGETASIYALKLDKDIDENAQTFEVAPKDLKNLEIELIEMPLNQPGLHLNGYVCFFELTKPIDFNIVLNIFKDAGEVSALYFIMPENNLLLITRDGKVRIIKFYTDNYLATDLVYHLVNLPHVGHLENFDFYDTIYCTKDIVTALNQAREKAFSNSES